MPHTRADDIDRPRRANTAAALRRGRRGQSYAGTRTQHGHATPHSLVSDTSLSAKVAKAWREAITAGRERAAARRGGTSGASGPTARAPTQVLDERVVLAQRLDAARDRLRASIPTPTEDLPGGDAPVDASPRDAPDARSAPGTSTGSDAG